MAGTKLTGPDRCKPTNMTNRVMSAVGLLAASASSSSGTQDEARAPQQQEEVEVPGVARLPAAKRLATMRTELRGRVVT